MKLSVAMMVVLWWTIGCQAVSISTTPHHDPRPKRQLAKLVFQRIGINIVEPGIFTSDCIYGKKASLSDHAPVIYGDTATWNITSLVTHRKARNSRAYFYTHRFRVSKNGTLINAFGNPVFEKERSETGRSSAEINVHYAKRLKAIAKKIKELFARYDLAHMALQEIPLDIFDKNGTNLRTFFASQLGPELIFLPPAPPSEGEVALDCGLVVRAPTNFAVRDADHRSRLQAFCDHDQSRCIVSVHLPFAMKANGMSSLCDTINSLIAKLFEQDFQKILVIGDFNVPAQRLVKVCKKWTVLPTVKTTSRKGFSCTNDQGGIARNSIDIALEFRRKVPVAQARLRAGS